MVSISKYCPYTGNSGAVLINDASVVQGTRITCRNRLVINPKVSSANPKMVNISSVRFTKLPSCDLTSIPEL